MPDGISTNLDQSFKTRTPIIKNLMNRLFHIVEAKKKRVEIQPQPEPPKYQTQRPFKIILPDRVINADGSVFYFKKQIEK